MKSKVLIISYFYPPCNLTSAKRVDSWAKGLHKFGYFPIIVTRHWDVKIKTFTDIAKAANSEESKEILESHLVYRLPYKPNLRDRIMNKYGNKKFRFIRRVLSFFEIIIQNFTLRFLPYKNLYSKSREVLKENPDIDKVIISGMPFTLFFMGFKLKREFKHINWFADYRDEWTTWNRYPISLGKNPIISFLEKRSERKWLSNAHSFIYVLPVYIKKMEAFLNLKGHVIRNGFEPLMNTTNPCKSDKNCLKIVFSGTLSAHQPLSVFAEGVKLFVEKNKSENIHVLFLGSGLLEGAEKRILSHFKGVEESIEVTGRVDLETAIGIQKEADVLLMLPIPGMEGLVTSKVYDYMAFDKPIMLVPSDHNALQDILIETNKGVVSDDPISCAESLKLLFKEKQAHGFTVSSPNKLEVEKYSRETQTRLLSELLDKI